MFVCVFVCVIAGAADAADDSLCPILLPEQQQVIYHDPANLPHVAIPTTPQPPTVREDRTLRGTRLISLDEAIRTALEHSEVVRVFTGAGATASGRTIYDAAIANQVIDQQRAAFDPRLSLANTATQIEPPAGALFQVDPTDPFAPVDASIVGQSTDNVNTTLDLSQRNLHGGTARYRFSNDRSEVSPGGFLPLNPQSRFFNEVSYSQPLLRGAGATANRVPIVLARLDAERSFFQLSGAMQQLVRGVVDAYWNVVFARTDIWAREIQVQQSQEAYDRALARKKADLADITEVSQTASALARFEAQLIVSEGNLLQAEAALLNILGLPPDTPYRLVPTTPPLEEYVPFDWDRSVRLAEERRPDLIELKLVLEADRQRLLQSQNANRPNLDAVASYRWNGLVGRTAAGGTRSSEGGQFTDWTLGLTFSVPLTLRAERAQVRSVELLLARDRANLMQGIHNAKHTLAANLRAIDQAYAQYEAFRVAREAARQNLEALFASYRNEREQVLFVTVLQAISDFGNAVSQEASALLQYNTALANLEQETGTILETHGIFLQEDLRCSAGPRCLAEWVGRESGKAYSHRHRPSGNAARYAAGDEASEEAFELSDPPTRSRRRAGEDADDADDAGDADEIPRLPDPIEEPPDDASEERENDAPDRGLDRDSDAEPRRERRPPRNRREEMEELRRRLRELEARERSPTADPSRTLAESAGLWLFNETGDDRIEAALDAVPLTLPAAFAE